MSDSAHPQGLDEDVKPSERAVALSAVEVFLRLLRHTRDCFPDDDLETVTVYLTVAAASTGHVLRDYPLLAELDGRPVPEDLKRPVSGRAIAAATALPRETVRRKLNELVSSGRLVRTGRSVGTPVDVLNRDQNREFARRVVRELNAAPGRLERFSQLDDTGGAGTNPT